MKQKSSHCKHKVVQDRNIFPLQNFKHCFENKELKHDNKYPLRHMKFLR